MPNDEIRAGFFEECDDLLASLGDGLTALDQNGADSETINAVFRAVHSIKGGAGAFGLSALVGFSHKFENLLDGMRNAALEVTPAVLALCFRASDHLADQVEAARLDETAPEGENANLLAEIDAALGATATAKPEPALAFSAMPIALDLGLPVTGGDPETGPEGSLVQRFTFTTLPGFFETGHEPLLFFRRLNEISPIEVRETHETKPLATLDLTSDCPGWEITLNKPCPREEIQQVFEFAHGLSEITFAEPIEPTLVAETAVPIPQAQAAKSSQAAPNPTAPTIRVDLNRVERLNNLAGELVINQAMLMQLLDTAPPDFGAEIQDAMDNLRTLANDLQDSVIAIRAQPVKPLFSRMSRIVREAAKSSGKAVRFDTSGEMTEIDKTALECLADPLTHMVRNAVDHGLEAADLRVKSGKPETGCVRLTAAHRSGKVVIELSDDGAGINRPRVRDIAISKGLIAADATLSDADIDNLLFLPGFSTAEKISDLSGRGVGMDVAKSEIQALGGRVSIRSTKGQGTTLSITLPLTLAVLEGMIVNIASERMVIPITSIVETMRATAEALAQLADGTWMISIRGQFLPIVDTAAFFGFRAPSTSFEGLPFLVVETEAGRRQALIVDQISEQSQVVIKGIADHYQPIRGISAATILGDGQIALIIDPEDLGAPASDPLQILAAE